MKVEYYPEEHCEVCNETMHTHFNCPSCKDNYAGTSVYGDMSEEIGNTFKCEECGAEYKLTALVFGKIEIEKIN